MPYCRFSGWYTRTVKREDSDKRRQGPKEARPAACSMPPQVELTLDRDFVPERNAETCISDSHHLDLDFLVGMANFRHQLILYTGEQGRVEAGRSKRNLMPPLVRSESSCSLSPPTGIPCIHYDIPRALVAPALCTIVCISYHHWQCIPLSRGILVNWDKVRLTLRVRMARGACLDPCTRFSDNAPTGPFIAISPNPD